MGVLEEMISEFQAIDHWEGRYRLIIRKGQTLSPYPEEYRLEEFKVKGCQSQVWLYPDYREGRITFYGDSDAAIVRGLIALLFVVYNGLGPRDILATRADFIDTLGLGRHLSMVRASGLGAMLKQIKLYALAFSGEGVGR